MTSIEPNSEETKPLDDNVKSKENEIVGEHNTESKSSNNEQTTTGDSSSSTSALIDQESVPQNSEPSIAAKSTNNDQNMTGESSLSSTSALDQESLPQNPQPNVADKSSSNDQIATVESSSADAFNDQESLPQNPQPNKSSSDQIATVESSSSTNALNDQESKVATRSLNNDKGDSSSSSTSVFNDEEPAQFEENSDLAESEKKALMELRSKVTEAILVNTLFDIPKHGEESAKNAKEKASKDESDDKGKSKQNGDEEEDNGRKDKAVEIDEDISIWGVPVLPSKGHKGTDVILLKFLRAREFKVNEACEMLRSSLQWRKQFKMDRILEEDTETEYDSVAYTIGEDREGHPVCYNIYGIFGDDEMYNKTFGTEEGRQKFLTWRLRVMEMQIKKLDFRPDGVSSLLQISDLNNAPGPSKKDIRNVTKEAVQLLQDNYPEFIARHIFINVPIWYYAFNALLSPFLTQRAKSKFIFSRPAGVTETLLQYIAAENIPCQYGGLHRDNDPYFSTNDGVSETAVKIASTQTIEIPAPEVGCTIVWDLIVPGWEVKYKEEFVPMDEDSYMLIVKKERKIGWQEESVRNTFKIKEAGKIVITISNASFKKKRVIYRHKATIDS